jgi:hypothetical protein
MTWVLILNDMRGRCEDMRPVARAETKEALLAFLEHERVEPYKDDGMHTIVHDTDTLAQMAGGPVVEKIPQYYWNKTFRKGGPLEWFNPPWGDSPENFVNAGTRDDHARRAAERFDRDIAQIPAV